MNAILLSLLVCLPHAETSLFCADPASQRGLVRGGPMLEHAFTLTNRSAETITILDVRGSCGCLTPRVSSRVLEPGATATLHLAVATASQPDGPNEWKTTVRYRARSGAESTLELKLGANLERDVGLTPAAVQLIGRPGVQHEILLTDRRARPLKLTAIRASASRLHVQVGTWEKSGEIWKCRIQLQLAEDCPAGTWDESVVIVGDEPGYRELRVPVRIICRGEQRVQVAPDMVQLRPVAGKPAASVLILLRDALGQPVEVTSAECADAALIARFAEGAYATAAVRVSIIPGKTPQPRSTVKIQIRKPLPETLTLPVEVTP